MTFGIGLATLIGAGLSFIGGLFSNHSNQQVATQNVEAQQAMNEQNIAFQKQENDITRLREDNAVQRAAADMTAAGLSKTLAAGNPASSQALTAPQTQAVNNSFKYESALQKMNIAQLVQSMAEKEKQLDLAEKKNDAEVNYINQQAAGIQFDNEHKAETFQAEQAVKQAQAFQFRTQGELNQNNAKIAAITSKYTADKLQSEIDLNIMSKISKQADIVMTGKQIKAMSYDIAMKVMQTKGFYIDNQKKKQELKMLVYDQAKIKLDMEVLKHNLNYAQKYNYPVGVAPSGLIGSGLGVGYSLGHRIKIPGVTNTSNGGYLFNFNGQQFGSDELTAYLNAVNGFNY